RRWDSVRKKSSSGFVARPGAAIAVVLRSIAMAYGPEFQEIGHCGGKFIVTVTVNAATGKRGVQFGVEHSSPRPAAWFAVYALSQHGIPVASIRLGGIGDPWNPAPYPG